MNTAQKANSRNIVDGEFNFTEEDFRYLASMLYSDAGISLPESKATLVYSRLAKRVRLLRLENFRQYCELVGSPEGSEERANMLAALTTNVTRFFREPHHFEHLKNNILPPLLEAARRGARIRLWSAACSNGQEPYSMALTILSMMPDAVRYDIRILATDIDPNMVAEGRAGTYDASILAPIPGDLRQKWFIAEGHRDGRYSVADELRELVSFKQLNLIGHWPMKGPFQVIMCRNVVIYFDEPTQAKIWSRFAPLIPAGGALYIGHSERLNGAAAALFNADGITTYLRQGGSRA